MSVNVVTGAAGFLGRQVVEELLRRGEPVRAMVRTEEQARELRERGVEVSVGDVRDPEAVSQAVRGARVVYHCAAAVAPHYSDAEIFDINRDGVRNVLEALRQAGSGRLVLVSSINVLGHRDLEGPSEDEPRRLSGEARADVKVDAEELALNYHCRQGVEVAILRPALIYGPGDRNLPQLQRAIERGKFRYLGSRDNVIPLVHVSDVAQAMVLAGESPKANGRIYHIADGARVTIRELVEYLADLAHCPPPRRLMSARTARIVCAVCEWLQRRKILKRAPLDRVKLRFLGTSRFIDIRRAATELGYHPQVDYREGIAAMPRPVEERNHGESDRAATRSPARVG